MGDNLDRNKKKGALVCSLRLLSSVSGSGRKIHAHSAPAPPDQGTPVCSSCRRSGLQPDCVSRSPFQLQLHPSRACWSPVPALPAQWPPLSYPSENELAPPVRCLPTSTDRCRREAVCRSVGLRRSGKANPVYCPRKRRWKAALPTPEPGRLCTWSISFCPLLSPVWDVERPWWPGKVFSFRRWPTMSRG